MKHSSWYKIVLDAVERIKVKPGEFYFIPAGMLHSIGSGVLVYETMQSIE
jgi:mannose-6-phosphate isomerase